MCSLCRWTYRRKNMENNDHCLVVWELPESRLFLLQSPNQSFAGVSTQMDRSSCQIIVGLKQTRTNLTLSFLLAA